MPFALNDICPNNGFSLVEGPRQLVSSERSSASFIATTTAVSSSVYTVVFEIFVTATYTALISFFEAVGFHKSFSWTPPGSVTAGKYKFTEFKPSPQTGTFFTISATIERKNGVA